MACGLVAGPWGGANERYGFECPADSPPDAGGDPNGMKQGRLLRDGLRLWWQALRAMQTNPTVSNVLRTHPLMQGVTLTG